MTNQQHPKDLHQDLEAYNNHPENTDMGWWKGLWRGATVPYWCSMAHEGLFAAFMGVLIVLAVYQKLTSGYIAVDVLHAVLVAGFCGFAVVWDQRGNPGRQAQRWVYAGAAVTLPLWYIATVLLVSLIVVLLVITGVVAAVIAVLILLGKLLGSGDGSGTTTIIRGANSHFNSDGRAKIEYASQSDATVGAVEHSSKFGGTMSAYPCEMGGHWHIGHAKQAG